MPEKCCPVIPREHLHIINGFIPVPHKECAEGHVELSARGLFKPVKATLGLTAVTAMNTAMTNVLLASNIHGNPVSPKNIFKEASDRVIKMILAKVEGELTIADVEELKSIADLYRQFLTELT